VTRSSGRLQEAADAIGGSVGRLGGGSSAGVGILHVAQQGRSVAALWCERSHALWRLACTRSRSAHRGAIPRRGHRSKARCRALRPRPFHGSRRSLSRSHLGAASSRMVTAIFLEYAQVLGAGGDRCSAGRRGLCQPRRPHHCAPKRTRGAYVVPPQSDDSVEQAPPSTLWPW